MSSGASTKRHSPFRYVLIPMAAIAILVPVWTVFVMAVWQPEDFLRQEQNMTNRFWWWVAGPVALVGILSIAHWMRAASLPDRGGFTAAATATLQTSHAHPRQEYVLEVIGLGVTLDKHRQGKLWDALQSGSYQATIRELDKDKYDWSSDDKAGVAGGRGGHSLENGVQYTPMYYGVPVFNAEPPVHNQ